MDVANEEGGGLKYALEFMTKNAREHESAYNFREEENVWTARW